MAEIGSLVRSTPVQPTLTSTGTGNLELVESQALSQKQQSAGQRRIAQATGSSAELTKAQVQQLNHGWRPGEKRKDMNEAESRIVWTTHDLESANLLVEKADGVVVVHDPIRMGSGINIPAGSTASGEGTEKGIYDLGRSGADLTFSLPNNSTISFSSNRSKGQTNVTVTDKASGVTTSSTFRAVLFFDANSKTLAFLSNATGGKFRISDLRALIGTSDPKLAAALKAVGLDSQR